MAGAVAWIRDGGSVHRACRVWRVRGAEAVTDRRSIVPVDLPVRCCKCGARGLTEAEGTAVWMYTPEPSRGKDSWVGQPFCRSCAAKEEGQ